jgi:hypothetical protein
VVPEVRARHVGGAAAMTTTSCRNATVRSGASAAVHTGRKVTAPGGKQSLALAVALGQLHSGTRLVIRGMNGREGCIRPGPQVTVTELRGAV